MTEIIEQVNAVTRPKLMPKKTWTREPTLEELTLIPDMEEEYIRARALFERYDNRAKDQINQNTDPIAPDVYVKWLRTATHRYTSRNAEIDIGERPKLMVQEAVMAGLGYMNPPRHGEMPLTVAPHGERVHNGARGFVADGDRVHLHHTPHFGRVSMHTTRNQAISVGIGDQVHLALHLAHNRCRVPKTNLQQVNSDFDFIKPHMEARGYTELEVERARQEAHDRNDDLGLYRGGK